MGLDSGAPRNADASTRCTSEPSAFFRARIDAAGLDVEPSGEPLPGAEDPEARVSGLRRIFRGSVGRNLGLVLALIILILVGIVLFLPRLMGYKG